MDRKWTGQAVHAERPALDAAANSVATRLVRGVLRVWRGRLADQRRAVSSSTPCFMRATMVVIFVKSSNGFPVSARKLAS